MKTFTIIFLIIVMNACGGGKEIASKLNNKSAKSSKLAQTGLTLKYKTSSRANASVIVATANETSYQLNRNDKMKVIPTDKKKWRQLMALIDTISLKDFNKIEAPSKAHQYDGAAGANLIITLKDGTKYYVPTFDAGNPNKIIAPIIDKIKSLIPNK